MSTRDCRNSDVGILGDTSIVKNRRNLGFAVRLETFFSRDESQFGAS